MGVDAQRFTRSRPHPETGPVVAVGRLVEKKGFRYLIEALATPDGQAVERLVIVGTGPLRGELEELARQLGVAGRVEFAGARPPEAVKALLEEAVVLAMPCVVATDGDRDSMPVVVKEALAMEVPVVVSDEVGLPEIVRDEWGRLVPPADSAALAAALRELLELGAPERAAMGARGREFIEVACDVHAEAAKLARLVARR